MVVVDEVSELPKVKPEDESYTNDADAAKAWRELWKALVKYNKKVADQPAKGQEQRTPLVRALCEMQRLQALDRTLARRLRAP